VASPCQDLPSQISVASGWLPRTRSPVTPTATHSDVARQETLVSPVATGGRLNGKAPPCEKCSRAPLPVSDAAAEPAAPDAARSAPHPTAAIAFRPRPARFRTTRITLTRIPVQSARPARHQAGAPPPARHLCDEPETRQVDAGHKAPAERDCGNSARDGGTCSRARTTGAPGPSASSSTPKCDGPTRSPARRMICASRSPGRQRLSL